MDNCEIMKWLELPLKVAIRNGTTVDVPLHVMIAILEKLGVSVVAAEED